MMNEPIYFYAPDSEERKEIKKMLGEIANTPVELHTIIGGKKIGSKTQIAVRQPHDHKSILGYLHEVGADEVRNAIEAALQVKRDWEDLSQEERNKIFLKAADLVAGKYRATINAATMLGQSKNAYQAEIDSACELADFFRFNVLYARQIQEIQPYSPEGISNRMEYRALEGFVVAITPFNFTAIAGNLPCAPALMGNVCVWKPAYTQARSAQVIMDILAEAGLPEGVINLVYADGPLFGDVVFSHPDFAGLHFTGSTAVFQHLWKTISANLTKYKSYPRIVGETGGKDFVWAHPSARVDVLSTALVRGAFEYQGQKCSAASRAYVPQSLWPALKESLIETVKEIRMGSVLDFRNFVNAVIDERAFDRITSYLQLLKNPEVEIVTGGKGNKSEGYFIEPTIARVNDPKFITMEEEIFGPLLSLYVYDDKKIETIPALIHTTSPYALTGAVLAEDENFLKKAEYELRHAAGNFYLNDKPTGAIVNQQPFGGGRGSGTNDKAGSMFNLLRWVSPRTIKRNYDPPTEIAYSFMNEA